MATIPDHVVVVGGGVAGYALADSLRTRGFEGVITILEREPALYDRPPLSKAALAGDVPIEQLAFATPEQLEARGIEVITDAEVTAIDPDAPSATLADGRVVRGDVLVLATGGRARMLPFPGNDLPGVHTLRNFADAVTVREAAVPGARFLVVGAGLIGAELSSALRQRGAEVVLIDPVPVPLASAVGEHLAAHLHGMHATNGIVLRTATLASVKTSDAGFVAELSDGMRLDVDLVVVGAGILPNTDLAAGSGLAAMEGILVDERHRTSAPRVFAIGDVARLRDSEGELHRRAEHWEAAQLDGRELAALLVGEEPGHRGAPWWWSDRHGVHVEGVGRMSGAGELVVREGPAHPAAFLLADGLLVGAVSIDDPNAVRAARRLIDQQIPVTPAQLADPSLALRELLRARA